MTHPYSELGEEAFWKTAVATKSMTDLVGLWRPKHRLLPEHKVSTFGSCFAQHLGPALRDRGFGWLQTEAPPRGLSAREARRFGYGRFTCRTGSLFTASLLLQWVDWAVGDTKPPDEHWQVEDRFVDPFRPTIEPGGFDSLEEMRASRHQAIKSFRLAISKANLFIFTLGLTESWFHSKHGWEYPVCPGTVGGTFRHDQYRFANQNFERVRRSLIAAIERIRSVRSDLDVLLTVSPVPLTATRSGKHVLVASTGSKSVLRAVAGQLADDRSYIDYFPSYELITAPASKGAFYEANQRSVSARGVDLVMEAFFHAMGADARPPFSDSSPSSEPDDDDPQCDDALLEAFSP